MPGTELDDRSPQLSLKQQNQSSAPLFRVFLWETFAIYIRDITFGIIFSLLFEKPFYHIRYTPATDKREYFLEQARELKTLTGITVDTTSPCFPEVHPEPLVLHRGDPCTLSPDPSRSRESALNSRLAATTIAKVFTKGGGSTQKPGGLMQTSGEINPTSPLTAANPGSQLEEVALLNTLTSTSAPNGNTARSC